MPRAIGAPTSPLHGQGARKELASSLINETLVRIGAVLSSELDLDVLVQKLTDEATTLCRAQFGAFFHNVVSTAAERWSLYTLSGVPKEAFASFPMPRMTPLFEPTFKGSTVVRLADVTTDPRYGRNSPHHGMPPGHLPVRSYLAVPVKSRCGEVLGALIFGHAQPGVFTEEDERLLVAVSAQAAIAIDNAKLFKAVRRAEEAAQAEREKLHALFMQSPAMIVILHGPEHIYEFVNSAAARRIGRDDLLGLSARDAPPAVPAEHVAVFDEVFESGERFVANEVQSVRDWDGAGRATPRYFNVVYEPYRGVDGRIDGILFFGVDVTDEVVAKRRIEAIVAELETANRMKDEFLATVSHELRTPLNAILGWVRMLRTDSLRPEKRAHALETIERNASVQSQLIEDLLDVSRIVTGKLRLDPTTVDIASVISNAVEAVRPAATAKGVALTQSVEPGAGPILGDPDRLQQVVWNLLANGVKFTPRGGTVAVSVHKRDCLVEIDVADSGQGIPPEFLPHVFERFRQADATTTRKFGGLGLGLAIVRSLVELHGGSVRVASEGRGKGSTFTVSLPIAPVRSSRFERPPPLRYAPSPPLGPHAELAGTKILVVDDEPDARELLAELLNACHVEVFTAGTVDAAMKLVLEKQPDVVVSDIGMPGEDGYDLIRKLRALPASHGGKTPAVALTAYARIEDRTKALVAGFNMHVPKPVEPSELLSVLTSLVAMFGRE